MSSYATQTLTYKLIRYAYLVREDEGAGWVLVVYRARRTCIRERMQVRIRERMRMRSV
jgi:hypothetical protein